MMNDKTIIETIDLTKVYGMGDVSVAALDGVSLQIKAGEFVAIMGPSGSGKSTLMHILGCLSRPTSGQYILDGQDISNMSKKELALVRNQKLGFIFQAYNLLPRTTAMRNVMMPLLYDRNRHLNDEEGQQKALKMLELVGLGDRTHHQPQELSGGQQQRVAIARALVNDPVLIIADEPTGNLDSQNTADIMALLSDLNQTQGTTLMIVTHNHEVAQATRRVITLRDGKIQSDLAVRSELESELLDFKSSALGQAIMRDEGLPEALRDIAPRLRELLETT
jgi:putative ABC transport system ATP-binding protein